MIARHFILQMYYSLSEHNQSNKNRYQCLSIHQQLTWSSSSFIWCVTLETVSRAFCTSQQRISLPLIDAACSASSCSMSSSLEYNLSRNNLVNKISALSSDLSLSCVYSKDALIERNIRLKNWLGPNHHCIKNWHIRLLASRYFILCPFRDCWLGIPQ